MLNAPTLSESVSVCTAERSEDTKLRTFGVYINHGCMDELDNTRSLLFNITSSQQRYISTCRVRNPSSTPTAAEGREEWEPLNQADA